MEGAFMAHAASEPNRSASILHVHIRARVPPAQVRHTHACFARQAEMVLFSRAAAWMPRGGRLLRRRQAQAAQNNVGGSAREVVEAARSRQAQEAQCWRMKQRRKEQ